MIEIELELPLARFALRVAARLEDGVTAVMGPSGSGKTSLLEAIAGLRPRARGRVLLDGRALLDSGRGVALAPEARRVGYVPQDAGLFPHLTARANVAFGARGDEAAVASAIATLELGALAERHPASLSGGEKQRTALARALATRPQLLLLDEPLAALDVGLRERILPYLLRVRDEWKTPALYVTHNVGEAIALAGQLLLLPRGPRRGDRRAVRPPGNAGDGQGRGAGVENLLAGRVRAHDAEGGVTSVELPAGQSITVPLAAERALGAPVTLAVRAEDVIVSKGVPEGISARNVFEVRITALTRTGADVTLRCASGEGGGAPHWIVRVDARGGELARAGRRAQRVPRGEEPLCPARVSGC